jgi:hypothetical protein
MTRLSDFLAIERELADANRNRLAQYYDQPFEKISTDQVAIAGVDGWQFIANGNNAWEQQYLGQLQLADSGIQAWQSAFQRRLDAAEKQGARFIHLVVPEKQAIYPGARWPAGTVVVVAERPVQQMQKHISQGLVYPIDRLHTESWRAELCFRGNSHWCVSGAWFGFCELMKTVWPERFFDFEKVPLIRSWWRHDLLLKFAAEVCHESVICIPRCEQVVYDNRLMATTGRHVGNHYVLQNSSAPYQEAVVIFGDSYSFDVGFSDLMAAFFGQVHFVWNTVIDFQYCRSVNAKLILMQSAERYLVRPHTQDLLVT